jgi:hypothetical protein
MTNTNFFEESDDEHRSEVLKAATASAKRIREHTSTITASMPIIDPDAQD